MKIETVESPFQVSLVGKSGEVAGKCYGDVGKKLMDAMWAEVAERGIETHGINHWVYLPDDRMFTGMEPKGACDDLGSLETMELTLSRYMRHLHVGPYTELPGVWGTIMKRIEDDGETCSFPSIEIYNSVAVSSTVRADTEFRTHGPASAA